MKKTTARPTKQLFDNLQRCAADISDYLVIPLKFVGERGQRFKQLKKRYKWLEQSNTVGRKDHTAHGVYVVEYTSPDTIAEINKLPSRAGIVLCHDKPYKYSAADKKILTSRLAVSLLDPSIDEIDRHIKALLVVADASYDTPEGLIFSVNSKFRAEMAGFLSVVTNKGSAVIHTGDRGVTPAELLLQSILGKELRPTIVEPGDEVPTTIDLKKPLLLRHPSQTKLKRLIANTNKLRRLVKPKFIITTTEKAIAYTFIDLMEKHYEINAPEFQLPDIHSQANNDNNRSDDRLLYGYAGYIRRTHLDSQALFPTQRDILKVLDITREEGAELVANLSERSHGQGPGSPFLDQLDDLNAKYTRMDLNSIVEVLQLCVYQNLHVKTGSVSAAAQASGFTKGGLLKKIRTISNRENSVMLIRDNDDLEEHREDRAL